MHELAAARSILETAKEEFGKKKVKRLRIEVGALSPYSPESVSYYLSLMRKKMGFGACEFILESSAGLQVKITGVEYFD